MERMELRCDKVKHIVWFALTVLFMLFCIYGACLQNLGDHLNENTIASCLLYVFIFLVMLPFAAFMFFHGFDQLVVIDEEEIQTTEWKVQWDEVVLCYIDYSAKNRPLLIVQTNNSLSTLAYNIDSTKFDRFVVGHFIDKMAGRNVFDIGKSAEDRGGNVALGLSILLSSVVAFFVVFKMRNFWLGILVGIGFGFAIYRVIKKAWVKRDWKKWRKGVV